MSPRPTSTSSNRRRHVRPSFESLESRTVQTTIPYGVPFTEMSQVADQFEPPDGPTALYLNFDGNAAQGVSAFFGTTGSVSRDIQEILFRTSQIFAPFNVEVKRAYGNGTLGAGDGATTLFVGDKQSNTSLFEQPGEDRIENDAHGVANLDYPSPLRGILHAPNSDASNNGFVDPYSYEGLSGGYSPANYDAWSNTKIAQVAAHEAAHTFGLAHVLSNSQAEIMSYDGGLMTYFRNKSYAVTNLNGDAPAPNLQPAWAYFASVGAGWALTPSPILTQNSYATLLANLGPRPTDGYGNVADAGAVDPIYVDGIKPVIALGGHSTGTVGAADHDVFTFTPGATQFVEITIVPTGVSQLDPVLLVMQSNGKQLAQYDDDSGPGSSSRLVFQATAGTTYHLVAAGYDGNSTGTYRIDVRTANFPVNPQGLPGGLADAPKDAVRSGSAGLALTATRSGSTGREPGPVLGVGILLAPSEPATVVPTRAPGFRRASRTARLA